MRYSTWVEKVFDGFVRAADGTHTFSLTAVADGVGITGLDWDAFARHDGIADAFVVAAYDLHDMHLIHFENVSHGNELTSFGRDVAERGIRSLRAEISAITLRGDEEAFLARLYEATRVEDADWAGLGGAEADAIYRKLHPDLDAYQVQMALMKIGGDLVKKGLIRRSTSGPTIHSYRPTYIGVVRISEPDGRDDGLDAGLLDWSTPTPGFDAIADRLAELKTRLASARSGDDLSDVGRRCRDIAADAMNVVFRPEMVPAGVEAPSPQDAKRRLELYLQARLGSEDFEALRAFLKASLALAQARTHSVRTGYAAAVAAAQGLLSFVRALEAIERLETAVSS
jgi:hypothetical protein